MCKCVCVCEVCECVRCVSVWVCNMRINITRLAMLKLFNNQCWSNLPFIIRSKVAYSSDCKWKAVLTKDKSVSADSSSEPLQYIEVGVVMGVAYCPPFHAGMEQ